MIQAYEISQNGSYLGKPGELIDLYNKIRDLGLINTRDSLVLGDYHVSEQRGVVMVFFNSEYSKDITFIGSGEKIRKTIQGLEKKMGIKFVKIED